jgi:hypothetical protein
MVIATPSRPLAAVLMRRAHANDRDNPVPFRFE